ncbi:putative holin [Pseudomonas sp.]|uniref:putative holin n=1 Tax=Pseudomonas sp. TaxID=306 RepID=UPI00272F13CA|nr:putative holin [Pseudomonas sp.]MDP2244029.1 putative holin [Pseudomonas sp.]
MAEPSTAAIVAAGALGAGFAGMLAGINAEAAVGALFGALLYFSTTKEMPVLQRTLFFLTSFVMGYLFSPAVGEFELWGMRPFAFPGPAAFGASLLVVTVSLAAIRKRAGESRGIADD